MSPVRNAPYCSRSKYGAAVASISKVGASVAERSLVASSASRHRRTLWVPVIHLCWSWGSGVVGLLFAIMPVDDL